MLGCLRREEATFGPRSQLGTLAGIAENNIGRSATWSPDSGGNGDYSCLRVVYEIPVMLTSCDLIATSATKAGDIRAMGPLTVLASRHFASYARLQAEIESLHAQGLPVPESVRSSAEEHNQTLPVNSLPPELLIEIFLATRTQHLYAMHTLGVQPRPPILTSICGLWRSIALSASKLWTFVDSHSPDAFEAYLVRSIPLNIVLSGVFDRSPVSMHMIEVVRPELTRIKSLHVIFDDDKATRELLPLPESMPFLEYITIILRHRRGDPQLADEPPAPRLAKPGASWPLKYLCLRSARESYHPCIELESTPAEDLQTFESNRAHQMHHIMNFVRRATQLQNLIIRGAKFSTHPNTPIESPSLHRISTTSDDLPLINHFLHAPKLRHLHVKDGLRTALFPNPPRSVRSAISLSFDQIHRSTHFTSEFPLSLMNNLVGIQIPFIHISWVASAVEAHSLPHLQWLILQGSIRPNDQNPVVGPSLFALLSQAPRLNVQVANWRKAFDMFLEPLEGYATRLWDLPEDRWAYSEEPVEAIEAITDAIVNRDVEWLTLHGLARILDGI